MSGIAVFEKVSFEQFEKDYLAIHPDADQNEIHEIYDGIILPKRATAHSAGYDFHAVTNLVIKPGQSILTVTGIRARINPAYVLMLFPRSSLGFRYRLQLDNTVGIIDADYYDADNEGHIMVRLTNDSRNDQTACIEKGRGYVQGVFVPFGITEDDDASMERRGGFGSTDLKGSIR